VSALMASASFVFVFALHDTLDDVVASSPYGGRTQVQLPLDRESCGASLKLTIQNGSTARKMMGFS
jgi:hypothetical protein